ncbi:unnamed protein product [Moneuplotes crassus]|uniref:Protein phosphatase n=1 Tax=Euplotes crassus TaxID=5936 RepID=A0AAD2D2E6_EUPCR|nr:unnamed protein product [Moneuplotes crassus]
MSLKKPARVECITICLFIVLATCAAQPCSLEEQEYEEYGTFEGYFESGSTIIPHPDKVDKGGEDALIVKDGLISVADGVGGWATSGVDPGLYSKQLIKFIGQEYEKNNEFTPKEILSAANNRTTHIGTSTCVIAILRPQCKAIDTTVLGDSSYLLLRPENGTLKTLFRSKEQQKSFNFPYQCGTNGDDPKLAVDNRHPVKDGDIIVMGSDGVFDNCFDPEIIDILTKNLKNGILTNLQGLSDEIAALSSTHGHDENWRSPFEISAEKAYHRKVFLGGKLDDISVIVTQIHLSKVSTTI